MGKLVVLKLGEGNFEQGFAATLQIGNENARPGVEITAQLPPDPEIPRYYHRWQSIYRSLDLPARPIGLPKRTQAATLEECQQAAEELKVRFNTWLASESFRDIREKWLEKLMPAERVRVLLQTKDLRLQKLPWHLWDLLERYPKAEIALSAPAYEQVNRHITPTKKVKILAILGHSQGIDTQADRLLLEQLVGADITFLVEPERKDLTDRLWEQHWQILFFAGHSFTQGTGNTGKIYINQTESLTISDLRYALRKAVERGLQLAILNSCDGLGLAVEFAPLQIPQIIVMREPVPDRVAQEFLKYFLEAFARGDPLYLAVREARERLQGLENQFPCATWLPVICQNPGEMPVNWQELLGEFSSSVSTSLPVTTEVKGVKNRIGFSLMLLVSVAMTGLLMGARYLGILQPFELQAFDQLLRLRPREKPDSRLLVVSITEEDVQARSHEQGRGSLSDKALTQLLEKLEVYQPQVIGLDIYRDYAADKNYPQLAKQMRHSDRFVAVCRVSNPEMGTSGVAPPPEVSTDRLGFSNILLDVDNVVRRHYLALTPPPSSPCHASYAFSVQLALRYLYSKGIKLQFTSYGGWKVGKLTFKPIEAHTGGYQGVDALGHQILLNYRSSPSPEAIAPQITLGQALTGKLNAAAVQNRIVIIGTTAESFHDYWLTPYATQQGNLQAIPGVILQAQMVSQLLSAALDGRPLLWSLPIWGDTIWIWGWSVAGVLLAWYLRRPIHLALLGGIAFIGLYGSCLVFLISFGCWVPLVPAALALGGSTLSAVVCLNSLPEQKTTNNINSHKKKQQMRTQRRKDAGTRR
ncbi:MAG: CHASE2 domain-containing protein [Chlorogloeopsis fritschii C42_A2020_084]|uniref:CHASE2 domain-containing protein n=1 Tax=Chlorogloeopsis fritschii TaxID=1124 RepID=UPI0019FE1D6E|nr:CHASE2 domain-containing protein [Chlorogloeopsis fritschii]MBF2009691.1 CHASE2 domain-containing protein [Chlorogloeopsis fritschii C42_A2020_084]